DQPAEQQWRRINQEQNLQVYRRRHVQGEQEQPAPAQREQAQAEQEGNAVGSSSSEGNGTETDSSNSESSLDRPIALRKGTWVVAPVKRYGFDDHDMSNYVSYEALSPSYQAFVASL